MNWLDALFLQIGSLHKIQKGDNSEKLLHRLDSFFLSDDLTLNFFSNKYESHFRAISITDSHYVALLSKFKLFVDRKQEIDQPY